jgi:hypothetical protein
MKFKSGFLEALGRVCQFNKTKFHFRFSNLYLVPQTNKKASLFEQGSLFYEMCGAFRLTSGSLIKTPRKGSIPLCSTFYLSTLKHTQGGEKDEKGSN